MKSRIESSKSDFKISVFPLLDWISAYLTDCLSRELSNNTIRFYQEKLDNLIKYCRVNSLYEMEKISTNDLRNYFIGLQKSHSK